MTNTKMAFEKRAPDVLKIIRETNGPINYTELYLRLVEETGVKISKTTFNKCLKFLLSSLQINRIKEKGPGNPVKYSVADDYYEHKVMDRIAVNSYLLKYFAEDYSPYGTEANLWFVLSKEISQISASLIGALMYYSQRSDGNEAYIDYRDTIQTVLVPHMMEIRKLVKSPIRMNTSTTYLLYKLFLEDVLESTKKPLHPLMVLTDEEEEKVKFLVNEKIAKNGIVFKEKTPESFYSMCIEDSKYIKEMIKYSELRSEAFFEIKTRGNHANPECVTEFVEKVTKFEEKFCTDIN
jgi:hypothetical protein